MHIDVEGFEPEVLRGARGVIGRDRPLITTEIQVHNNKKGRDAASLVSAINALGYDSYLVEEICGMRADLRNLLNVPRSRTRAFHGSNVLDLAVASRVLIAVTNETISNHAFPCCKPGGACCPWRDSRQISTQVGCCAHFRVNEWLRRTVSSGEIEKMKDRCLGVKECS